MTPRALTLVVALTVAAAWVPSLRNGFVWDDQYDIIRSDRLHHARAIGDVFVHHAMWSADQPETAIATYRPLALATLAVDYQIWKLRPAGYHATNVLLHVLATLAVLLALAALVGDVRWAAALALLFALHPANAEAVASINGRSEMLALGFGAVAVWAAMRQRFVLLAVALFLALLGKETAALFVPVTVAVALLARYAAARWQDAAHFVCRPIAAVLVAAGAYAAMRGYALGHTALPSHAGAAATLGAVWSRATFAAVVPWRSAPIELSTFIGSLTPATRIAWTSGGALLGAVTIMLAVRRRWLPALGLGWWLLAIAPTAAIAALDYPWPGLARWLYLGLPGLCLVAYSIARHWPARTVGRLHRRRRCLHLRQPARHRRLARRRSALLRHDPREPHRRVGVARARHRTPGAGALLRRRRLFPPGRDARSYRGNPRGLCPGSVRLDLRRSLRRGQCTISRPPGHAGVEIRGLRRCRRGVSQTVDRKDAAC